MSGRTAKPSPAAYGLSSLLTSAAHATYCFSSRKRVDRPVPDIAQAGVGARVDQPVIQVAHVLDGHVELPAEFADVSGAQREHRRVTEIDPLRGHVRESRAAEVAHG